MKSKISFFNKTIYLKNITLYWPIWGIYLVCLLLSGPAMLWLCLREEAMEGTAYLQSNQLELIQGCTDLTWSLILSIIMALLTAMALFNYLSTSKSANMIHAFPVSRFELYGTNLLSGLTFLFVPQIITFLLNVFICLAFGAGGVEYMAMWLLVSMGVSFFFFSVAVFCTFLTGQMFAVPFYYVVIIFLYDIIRVTVGLVVEFIGFGIDFSTMFEYMDATWLSPAHYLWDGLYLDSVYTEVNNQGLEYCTELVLHGGKAVALYLIPAVILLVVAYLLYKKRHIETAGDLITVSWLKPIVRWGVGFFAGYFLGVALCGILSEFYIEVSKPGLFFAVLIISIVFFFATEMCIQKSFKVFKKKRWIECGGFAVFMLVTFLAINFSIKSVESYVPEKDEIDFVSIDLSYGMDLEGDEVDMVIELHQHIVDHMDEYRDMDWRYYDGESYWFSFTYFMKDGDRIDRYYSIPQNEETKALLEKIQEYEQQPEHFLDYLFGTPYEDSIVLSGYVEYYTHEYEGYECVDLTQTEAQKLYEAAVQDALDGNLQKYNYSEIYYYDEVNGYYEVDSEQISTDTYDCWVGISVRNPREAEKRLYYGWDEYYMDEISTDEVYLSIGKDCKNLVQALIDLGLVSSENELENLSN